jgi:adenine-specific DNA-methyltransferase
MTTKQKLELTWVGKENRPQLEPRILLEDAALSYHAPHLVGDNDIFDNRLIFGDNLLALKALEQEFAGKVKCVFIDPPYNTGSAFEHYDDGLEHSVWLSLIRDRVEILKKLLALDGLMFVQIDDNEVAYLTVLLDEIFGRSNRVNIIAVKMSEATGVKMSHVEKRMPKQKEYVLVYKKDGTPKLRPIKLPREAWNDEYKEVLLGADEENLEKIKELLDQEEASAADVAFVNSALHGCEIQSLNSYFKQNAIPEKERDAWKWTNAWRIVQAVGAGSLRERALAARTENQVSAVLSARSKLSIFKTNFDEASRDPRIRLLFADKYLTYNPGDFWTDIKTAGGVGQEGGVDFPKGKKPESLRNLCISF